MSFIKRMYPEASDECVEIYENNYKLFREIFRCGSNATVMQFKMTGRVGRMRPIRGTRRLAVSGNN
jgi:hypothetical protein